MTCCCVSERVGCIRGLLNQGAHFAEQFLANLRVATVAQLAGDLLKIGLDGREIALRSLRSV